MIGSLCRYKYEPRLLHGSYRWLRGEGCLCGGHLPYTEASSESCQHHAIIVGRLLVNEGRSTTSSGFSPFKAEFDDSRDEAGVPRDESLSSTRGTERSDKRCSVPVNGDPSDGLSFIRLRNAPLKTPFSTCIALGLALWISSGEAEMTP